MPWDTVFWEKQQEQREGGGMCSRGRRNRTWRSLVATCRWGRSVEDTVGQSFVLNKQRSMRAGNKPCPNTGLGEWTGEDRSHTRLPPTQPCRAPTSTLTSRLKSHQLCVLTLADKKIVINTCTSPKEMQRSQRIPPNQMVLIFCNPHQCTIYIQNSNTFLRVSTVRSIHLSWC